MNTSPLLADHHWLCRHAVQQAQETGDRVNLPLKLVRRCAALCFLLVFGTGIFSASAAVLYVSLESPSPVAPYTNWDTAAHTIQEAVDSAQSGDTVFVTNGVYGVGGRAVVGIMTNRVAIDKAIVVQSTDGPETTTITGAAAPTGGNGAGAVRCAYVGARAVLSGFTLRGGNTCAEGDSFQEQSGGGVFCEDSGIVTNCWIIGNVATHDGGGMYGGVARNCILAQNAANYGGGGAACTIFDSSVDGNVASTYGGGVIVSTLYRTSLTWNYAKYSAGASWSTLDGCRLTSNWAAGAGGGASHCTLRNCWLRFNSARSGGGADFSTLWNCVVESNGALIGGGTDYSTHYHCTVTGNGAEEGGGGSSGTFHYSIVYYNAAAKGPNSGGNSFYNSCVAPDGDNVYGWGSNITNEPNFFNRAAGDYRLRLGSPCIDAGAGLGQLVVTNDIDGNPRPVDGWWSGVAKCDIGAYEYNPATMDSDGDGATDEQEHITDTCPTNAASYFRVTAIPSASRPTICFQSSLNRQYTLFYATNLVGGGETLWMPVAGRENIPGTGELVTITDTNTNPQRFYKIGVSIR